MLKRIGTFILSAIVASLFTTMALNVSVGDSADEAALSGSQALR